MVIRHKQRHFRRKRVHPAGMMQAEPFFCSRDSAYDNSRVLKKHFLYNNKKYPGGGRSPALRPHFVAAYPTQRAQTPPATPASNFRSTSSIISSGVEAPAVMPMVFRLKNSCGMSAADWMWAACLQLAAAV